MSREDDVSGEDRARPSDARPVLGTGGARFIGCNIAERPAGEGRELLVHHALTRAGADCDLEGTANLLDAVRTGRPDMASVLASTDKVHGDLGAEAAPQPARAAL